MKGVKGKPPEVDGGISLEASGGGIKKTLQMAGESPKVVAWSVLSGAFSDKADLLEGVDVTVALKMVAGVDGYDSVVVGRISTKDEGEEASTWPSDTDVDFKVSTDIVGNASMASMTVVETEVGGTRTEPIFTVGEGAIEAGTCSVTDATATTEVHVSDGTAATRVETVRIVSESILATVTEAEVLIPSGLTSGTETEG